MTPGKKPRYCDTPKKTVAQIYKEIIRQKRAEGCNQHLIDFLSRQEEVWGQLFSERHAASHAATSGTENTAEGPSQSTKYTRKGSRSDIASAGHQSPKVSPNSPVTSKMRRKELIPGSEINQSTAVIAPVGISEEAGTGKKRFQSQSCIGKKSRFNADPQCAQPPKESLTSPAIRGMKQDDLIHDSKKSSTLVIAPVKISELEGNGKVLDASSLCHQTPKQSPDPPITVDRRRADLVTVPAAVSDSGSSTLAEMSQQAIYQTPRDEFVQELRRVVEVFENNMPTGLWDVNANDEQLNAFLTQFDEKTRRFRETILESVSKIAKLELSPILNVSVLSIFYSNVLHVAINAEIKRLEYEKLLKENSSNPDVINITQYYFWCWRRFEAYHIAYEKYLKTLPETFYPKTH